MLTKFTAITLAVLMVFMTMPVAAADFSSPKPILLGSISAIGNVQLRGVSISNEGTIFAGDHIITADRGYAKILLSDGDKLQLAGNTEIDVLNKGTIQLAMNTGNVGFTGSGAIPLRIVAGTYEVMTDTGSGNVAIMDPSTLGVRAVKGKVTVHGAKGQSSFVLTEGQERIFNVKTGQSRQPIAVLASALPAPIPVPAPVPQGGGRGGGGLALDAGAWAAIAAGAGLAVVALVGLVYAKNAHDDIKDLTASVNTLTGQTTQQQASLRALQAGNAALAASIQAQSNATALLLTLNDLETAVNNSSLTAAQKATSVSQISAARASIQASAVLAAQQQANLQNLLNTSNPNRDSINTAITGLNSAISGVNTGLGTTTNLLATSRSQGVPNVPATPGVTVIPPQNQSSASIPV